MDIKGRVLHLNGDTLDNRKENLELVDVKSFKWLNSTRPVGCSGYRGVRWRGVDRRWIAEFRGRYVGGADTPEEAYWLYCREAEKYYNFF